MPSVTEEADEQRWLIIQDKVFGAKDLTWQQQTAVWRQLRKQDLSYVEGVLHVEPARLTEVLRQELAGSTSSVPSVTEEAHEQRWLIIQDKVSGAQDLTWQQRGAVWKQLRKQDLSYVEGVLNVGPELLSGVLRNELAVATGGGAAGGAGPAGETLEAAMQRHVDRNFDEVLQQANCISSSSAPAAEPMG